MYLMLCCVFSNPFYILKVSMIEADSKNRKKSHLTFMSFTTLDYEFTSSNYSGHKFDAFLTLCLHDAKNKNNLIGYVAENFASIIICFADKINDYNANVNISKYDSNEISV